MTQMAAYRIRRCNGNKNAWLLVALRFDGTESQSHGGSVTAMSLDDLLRSAPHGLRPLPGEVVEFIPYPAV